MTMPDGSTEPLTTLDVRETEYTVGVMGPEAMPATLPPTSGYTYAVELSVDQAINAGATSVQFSEPLPFYLQNFLNFPVGMAAPNGYYDRQEGQWIPAADGRVIKILSITNGEADLDTEGQGTADSASQLAAIGITDAERQTLSTLYSPGDSVWRVPITHFSSHDINWPYGPPDGADGPDTDPNDLKDNKEGDQDLACGSVIGIENQTLGETIPITGTPFSLVYESDRVAGDTNPNVLTIPLTGNTLPPQIKRVELNC